MKGFYFDLLAPAPRLHWLRAALLLAGLLAAGAAIGYWQFVLHPRLSEERQLVQAEIAKLGYANTPASTMNAKELTQAWQRAREASLQLTRPWQHLFVQLASASRGGNVALMSIEPDGQRGQVLLVAEARSMDAMLQFLKELQDSADFSGVVLQSHTINKNVPEKPVRFRVSATWRTTE
jgi:Tfp pilus assembly protein PilN